MIGMSGWIDEFGAGIRKVYLTTRLPGSRGNLRGAAKMLARSGWAYTYFKVWTNKILPAALRRRGLPGGVVDYLRRRGCSAEVEWVESVNAPRVVSEVANLKSDYLVSFSATERFKPPLVAAPRIAAVNMHFAPLPAYAGLSPYFWQLFHQEPSFGISLHRIERRLDTGPIISTASGPLDGVNTALDVFLRMSLAAPPLLVRLFRGESDVSSARPQDPAGRTYFGHPSRRQMREFRKHGYSMHDAAAQRRVMDAVAALDAIGAGSPSMGQIS